MICKECKKPCEKTGPNQKYCEACRYDVNLRNAKERQKRLKESKLMKQWY